jgi:hypothetical protein
VTGVAARMAIIDVAQNLATPAIAASEHVASFAETAPQSWHQANI